MTLAVTVLENNCSTFSHSKAYKSSLFLEPQHTAIGSPNKWRAANKSYLLDFQFKWHIRSPKVFVKIPLTFTLYLS